MCLSSTFVLLFVFFLLWEHSGADKIYNKLKGIKISNYSKKMKEPICFVFFLILSRVCCICKFFSFFRKKISKIFPFSVLLIKNSCI